MSLVQAYLAKSSTQRILSQKPGEKGFSLIELVVVVAVLAILAAIAIPQFSALSDDARLNTTKSILANSYKECEYNKARSGTGTHSAQVDLEPNGVYWGGDADSTACATLAVGKLGNDLGASEPAGCILALNLSNGDKFYENAADAPAAGNSDWVAGWPNNYSDCT